MQSKTIKLLALFLLAGMLSACSVFRDLDTVNKDDRKTYEKAEEMPPLKVPSELTK